MFWKNPKLLVALALLVGAVVLVRLMNQPAPVASASDGTSSPFQILPEDRQYALQDYTLTPVNGKPFKLSDALKNGPVVLDFWATYCGPCRMELPVLDSIREKYQQRGVQFYAINASDDPATIKTYAQQAGLAISMLTDTNANISRDLGVDAIPVTVVIAGNRKIVSCSIGFDEDMGSDLPSALDQVLQEKI